MLQLLFDDMTMTIPHKNMIEYDEIYTECEHETLVAMLD